MAIKPRRTTLLIGCDKPFTVKHFLLDCADIERVRRSYFQVNSLKALFKDVSVVSTVSKKIKINLEGQNYVHFEVILSRNVKIFGIMASL